METEPVIYEQTPHKVKYALNCVINDITTLLGYFNNQVNLLLITHSGPSI